MTSSSSPRFTGFIRDVRTSKPTSHQQAASQVRTKNMSSALSFFFFFCCCCCCIDPCFLFIPLFLVLSSSLQLRLMHQQLLVSHNRMRQQRVLVQELIPQQHLLSILFIIKHCKTRTKRLKVKYIAWHASTRRTTPNSNYRFLAVLVVCLSLLDARSRTHLMSIRQRRACRVPLSSFITLSPSNLASRLPR